jgi:hypothetical protein
MSCTSRYLITKSTVSVTKKPTTRWTGWSKGRRVKIKVMFSQAKKWRLICTRFKQRLAPLTTGPAGVTET